jgi:hypothetical protein
MKWGILALLLLPCVGLGQPYPSPGNVGSQPSDFSRHLLTLPNEQQWQGVLGINPNGKLVAGSNVNLQAGSGFTIINAVAGTNTNALALFISTNGNLAHNATIIQQAHGFTNTPSIVEGVLVCITNDNNFVVGQEFNCAYALGYNSGGALLGPAFNTIADGTNVYLIQSGAFQVEMVTPSSFAFSPITLTNWQAKVYARP